MRKRVMVLFVLACFLLGGCTINVLSPDKNATSTKVESISSEAGSSSEIESKENSEKSDDGEEHQKKSNALSNDLKINLPELDEVGYATEGLGGWDETVSLSASQKTELYELLQINTWTKATDLPDGIGFGDGVLRARDTEGRCIVTVLGVIEKNLLHYLSLMRTARKHSIMPVQMLAQQHKTFQNRWKVKNKNTRGLI